jgi:hypothetical protein
MSIFTSKQMLGLISMLIIWFVVLAANPAYRELIRISNIHGHATKLIYRRKRNSYAQLRISSSCIVLDTAKVHLAMIV